MTLEEENYSKQDLVSPEPNESEQYLNKYKSKEKPAGQAKKEPEPSIVQSKAEVKKSTQQVNLQILSKDSNSSSLYQKRLDQKSNS